MDPERTQSLDHVLSIGGPPGSGKTTIASGIARLHGLRWYNADWHTWEHRDRALRAGLPVAQRWEAMTPEERWVTATPTEMLELSLHSERGPMIVDDLQRLPAAPLIVAEGSPVSPGLVSSGVADPSRAVWLIPTPEFHRSQLEGLDPGRRKLYLLLGTEIAREVKEHGAPILEVDGSRGIEQILETVEERFADALAEGPRARSLAERRALLREANTAIAEQVRGYYMRPWAVGDAATVVRTFLCECGDPGCAVTVDLAVGASTEPVLAPGHA